MYAGDNKIFVYLILSVKEQKSDLPAEFTFTSQRESGAPELPNMLIYTVAIGTMHTAVFVINPVVIVVIKSLQRV